MMDVSPQPETCEMEEMVDPWDDEEESPFLRLPEEMVLHICSFLDVKDIVTSLSKVCRKFYYMLQSNRTWRTWLSSRFGCQNPLVRDDNPNWQQMCLDTEKCFKLMTSPFKLCQQRHSAIDLDCILLLNNGEICVSGSRDRSIMVWGSLSDEPKVLASQSAHNGWVWRLKYVQNKLYSSSWDHTVKVWDLNASSGEITETASFPGNSAALSMDISDQGVIFIGSSNYFSIVDPRVGITPICVSMQGSPVLTINKFNEDLIVGKETNTLLVWDIRASRARNEFHSGDRCYPLTGKVNGNLLHMGDRGGNLRLYQYIDGELTKTYQMATACEKTVFFTQYLNGGFLTGCDTGVYGYYAFTPETIIGKLTADNSKITSMDYCNGVFAFGTPNSIQFHISQI